MTKQKKAPQKEVQDTTPHIPQAPVAEQPAAAPDKVQEELAQAHDKHLRLYSEFENFRRRVAKEKLTLIATAGKDVLKKFLPIVDDLERALGTLSSDDAAAKGLHEGVKLIHDKFTQLLQQAGVKPMLLDPGTAFDADLHEAITQIPVEDPALKGKIVDVVEKGYLLQDTVLRFAKVVTGA